MATGKRPQGSDHDDLTQRLVDEAGRLLTEHGVDGLSLRRLAAVSGTSTMAVYTRFGGKPQLLAAMYREGFRRLGAALTAAPRPGDDPLTALAEVGRAYRRAALAGRDLYGLMFGPPPPGLELSAADVAAADATYRPLVAAVARCVAAGVMTGDPPSIARHLWVVVHGAVGLELAGRLPASTGPPEHVYEEALVLSAAPFLAPGT